MLRDSSDSSSTSESEESSKDGKDHGDSDAEVGQESNGPQSWQEIAKIITNAQQRNIRHDAAKVARSAMPFESMDEMHAYILDLERALTSNEYPAGFGLSEEYESVESYRTGRSSRPLIIPLPYEVWFSRIVVWSKALDLLKRLPVCKAAVVPLE